MRGGAALPPAQGISPVEETCVVRSASYFPVSEPAAQSLERKGHVAVGGGGHVRGAAALPPGPETLALWKRHVITGCDSHCPLDG